MQQNLKLNLHGMVGILCILLMFGVAFALNWNINWRYFVIAVVSYSAVVLFLTSREERKTGTALASGWDVTFRLLLGCHLALIFLITGLLIRPDRSLFNLHVELSTSILLLILGVIGFLVGLIIFFFLVAMIMTYAVFHGDEEVGGVTAGGVVFVVLFLAFLDVRGGYFIASVIGGLALPFLLLKERNSINLHGIIGMIFIILMFGIAFFYDWTISWWYFILAIALYSGTIIFLTHGKDLSGQGPTPELFKSWLGCHLAFVFLMVGFALHFQNEGINVGFFIAGVMSGLVIPNLLFR